MDQTVEEFVKPYLENKSRLAQQATEDENPYEVKNPKFRHVSNVEYIQPVNKNVAFSFVELVDISKRTTLNPQEPPGYYKHDPLHMIKALVIACNMEHAARSAASTIPHKGLQTLENNDTTRIIEYIKEDKEARERVSEHVEEYIYSLLAVDAATKVLPSPIKELLAPVSTTTTTKNNNNNTNTNK